MSRWDPRTGGAANWAPTVAWRLFQLLTLVTAVWACWRLLGHVTYRIDIDVYRMGGRAWLDGKPLYADGAMFQTRAGLDLPFTYPPLAAIAFAPFAVLPLSVASAAITVITFVLLIASTVIVLTRMDVWPRSSITTEPAWLRRLWVAAAIVAPALIYLEPIRANFEFGQINVVLMTLVIADCVPRRTPWPRGMLLGVAIALKLTPAVFLLYFMLRRDSRALIVATASAVVSTLLGFVFAWRDSWEYWTDTVRNTDRIGTATLNTNQNIAGALARLGLGEGERFALWTLACFAVLGVTIWAARRILRAGAAAAATSDSGAAAAATSDAGAAAAATSDAGAAAAATSHSGERSVLALTCVAMFGLVVSPVSWSHHWVWALPTVMVCALVAYRQRHALLGAVTAAGVALMVWTPITLMPEHHETTASLWRQVVGGSYVWWALAVIVVAGTMTTRQTEDEPAAVTDDAAPVPATSSNG
ncbi:glycosyltransferase family 87 protein [Mycobacterium sp. 1274761.0]|uniref:glycosyltransferase family 87 protein n=1 Tax=Mycobacterium sp. 1274761.0 TaxID=1834077 RepID=UPI0008015613|nr:glycosyltransferase family 87 protein [Mycobacterium sp. 1274761.0]OBK72241.1 alpha-(1-2)-phosphatidylinositol mannosyltransferase [Mycobacterium sp. 1274761.0]